jgi:hypothetical protein
MEACCRGVLPPGFILDRNPVSNFHASEFQAAETAAGGRDAEPLTPSSRVGYNVRHGQGICEEGRWTGFNNETEG